MLATAGQEEAVPDVTFNAQPPLLSFRGRLLMKHWWERFAAIGEEGFEQETAGVLCSHTNRRFAAIPEAELEWGTTGGFAAIHKGEAAQNTFEVCIAAAVPEGGFEQETAEGQGKALQQSPAGQQSRTPWSGGRQWCLQRVSRPPC